MECQMATAEILADYMTDAQLAEAYDKSPRTIKRWRREGKAPPSIPFGNKRLTHIDDAKAKLEAMREEARAADGAKRRAR